MKAKLGSGLTKRFRSVNFDYEEYERGDGGWGLLCLFVKTPGPLALGYEQWAVVALLWVWAESRKDAPKNLIWR